MNNYTGPDKLQSTYWWEIFFIPGRRKDKRGHNLETRVGYSKWEGQYEALDPWRCLASKIVMLEQNRYIDDCIKIEIHRRRAFICKDNDPILLTLLPKEYWINPEFFTDFSKDVRLLMNNLYKAKATGKANEHGFPLLPKSLAKKDDMLNRTSFRNWEELYQYGDKLKASGFSQGTIAGYIHREMERMHYKSQTTIKN